MTFWPRVPKLGPPTRTNTVDAPLMTGHMLKDHIKIDKLLQMADIDSLMDRVKVTVQAVVFKSLCHMTA